MRHDQLRMLTAELPPGVTETKPGKGDTQYLKIGYVINRLNQIFGFDGWSFEVLDSQIVKHWEEGTANVVVCSSRVRLTVYARPYAHEGDREIVRENVGTCKNKQRDFGECLDTALKGAVSDGLKRCASLWGTQFGVFDDDPRRQKPGWWCGDAQQAVEERGHGSKAGRQAPPPHQSGSQQRQRGAEDTGAAKPPPAPRTDPRTPPARRRNVAEEERRQAMSNRLHQVVAQLCNHHNIALTQTLERVKGLGYKLAKVERNSTWAQVGRNSAWAQVGPLALRHCIAVAEDMQKMPSAGQALDHLTRKEVEVGLPRGG